MARKKTNLIHKAEGVIHEVSRELLGIKSEALWRYLFSANWGRWGRNVSVNYNTLESGLKRLETILNDKSFMLTDEWKEFENSIIR